MKVDELQKYYYFAYGMNTAPRMMSQYSYCEPIGAGMLNGYHLTFRQFANVERGGSLMGVIWKIDIDTLRALDTREGYPTMYGRQFINIKGTDGKIYRSYVYIMTDEYVEQCTGYPPSRNYIKMLADGYGKFGISVDQIRQGLEVSEVSIDESINLDVFKRGFEDSTPFGKYTLVAAHGQLPYVPGSKAKDSSQFRIEAKLGKATVGWVNFEKVGDHLEALDVYMDRDHRGKKVATAMYNFAKKLGNDLQPSSKQTALGKQFTKSYFKDAK